MPNTPLKGDYNTYIGARYVPIIGGMWNQQTEYEPLTIVMYQGSSYTSKTFVPKGTQIDNTTYWIRTANYDEQVEFYRQEVQQYKKDIDASEAEYIATVQKAQEEFITSTTASQKKFTDDITKQQNEYESTISNRITNEVPTSVSNWLSKNVTNPTNPIVDKTLTIDGAAADAKATGDLFSSIDSDYSKDYVTNLELNAPDYTKVGDITLHKGAVYIVEVKLSKAVNKLSYVRISPTHTNEMVININTNNDTASRVFFASKDVQANIEASINVDEYPVTIEKITITEQANIRALALKSGTEEFSTVGNANLVKINTNYKVHPNDYTDTSNLPKAVADELEAWPSYLFTYAHFGTGTGGIQLLITTGAICWRTIVHNRYTVIAGSVWRTYSKKENEIISSTVANTVANEVVKKELLPIDSDYSKDYVTNFELNAPDYTKVGDITLHKGAVYIVKVKLSKAVNKLSFVRITPTNPNEMDIYINTNNDTASGVFFASKDIQANIEASINVDEYPVTIEKITITEQANIRALALKSGTEEFSTVGNANLVKINTNYQVHTNDYTDTSNLPEAVADELKAWPSYLFTYAHFGRTGGIQLLITTNAICWRTIVHNGYTVLNGSAWKTYSKKENEIISSTVANTVANEVVKHVPNNIYNNAVQSLNTSDVYSIINGAYLAKSITTNRINCTPSNIHGVHGSNIYIYNGKIYLIYDSNKIDSSEDHTKYNIELTICNLDGSIISSIPIVSVGDTINNDKIYKCQMASILPIGDTIHIYCDLSRIENTYTYKLYHVCYSIPTNTFSEWDEVTYNDVNNNNNIAENGEQYICQNWFNYNGHDYCTAVYFNNNNFGIAYTENFTTFNIIISATKLLDIVPMGAGGESSAIITTVGNISKILLTYRTGGNNDKYLAFCQYNLATNSWEDMQYIPDATARPMFFRFNNNVYLANNSPYSRKDVTIWKYNIEGWSTKGLFEPVAVARTNTPNTYFSFYTYNDKLYIASIADNLTKIIVAVIEPEKFNKNTINTKLVEMFE